MHAFSESWFSFAFSFMKFRASSKVVNWLLILFAPAIPHPTASDLSLGLETLGEVFGVLAHRLNAALLTLGSRS